MSSLKTLREILDQKISDKKQLDIKTWKKAINIATAKSKKPKDMWSRRAMRYQNAVDNFEIIECGKILQKRPPTESTESQDFDMIFYAF